MGVALASSLAGTGTGISSGKLGLASKSSSAVTDFIISGVVD